MRKVRIRAILRFSCTTLGSQLKSGDRADHIAQTLTTFSAFWLHIALLSGLRKLADSFPAKTACRSWFEFAQSIPYAVSGTKEPRLLASRNSHMHTSSLSSGKQSASLQRPNKGDVHKVCLSNPRIVALSNNPRPRMARMQITYYIHCASYHYYCSVHFQAYT